MSFLDAVKNPGKAISDGWNAVTDTASAATQKLSEAVQKPIDFTKSLVNTAYDKGINFVSSVTNIDADKIKGTLSAIGTVVTHPISSLVQGVSAATLSTDAQSIVKNISSVALLTSPLSAGIALTQVASDRWLSADKKVSVQKVDSLKNNKDAIEFSDLWDIYDSEKSKSTGTDATATTQKPTEAVVAGDANKPAAVRRTADKTDGTDGRSYTNANGERAQVQVSEGRIDYTATKDGHVVTLGTQTAERSTLMHQGETATLETKVGKLSFTSEQVQVLQQNGNAEVKLQDGRRVIRKDDVLQLFDNSGHLLQEVQANLIKIGNDIKMYGRGTNLEAKADETTAEQQNSQTINVLATTDGEALAMLPDGSRIQLRKDGNAIMKLSNGQVVLVEGSGKVLILKDGSFEEISGEKAEEMTAKVTDGRMQLQNGQINFQGGKVNLREREIEYQNGSHQMRHVKVQRHDNRAVGIRVQTPEQVVETNEQTNVVKTTDTAGNTSTTDITKGNIETAHVNVTQEQINVKHTDGTPDTVIKSNNDVQMRGDKNKELHHDGSLKLDEQTETDAAGNVRSGSWHASAGGAFGGPMEASIQFQGKAIAVSMTAQDTAAAIRDRALRGQATYSDVAALNNDLGNVTALINQLAALGCTEYIPQLQNSCSALIETLNIAVPTAAKAA